MDTQLYKIKLKKEEEIKNTKRININILNCKKFSAPATLCKTPKIYIVKLKSKIIYVGITNQTIKNRLRSGCNPKEVTGYHGYKWKNLEDDLELYIFTFKNQSENRVEAVEAEIVYLIRNRTGLWPEYQTEIHFHHNATKHEKDIAKKIYKQIN